MTLGYTDSTTTKITDGSTYEAEEKAKANTAV
jgi:hypothetical protein